MAGHSKWASIKHKKKAVDAKRGALFTKLTRAITVAARDGGDPEANPTLALAVQKARDASMPKDNIERAIAKGTGADSDADAFESVLYEGYGPGGVAILVEALTDNRNRTGSEVRHIFTKHGGNLGEPGSVAWTFEKKGEIVVDGSRYAEDDLLAAIDAEPRTWRSTETCGRSSPARPTWRRSATRSRRKGWRSSRPSWCSAPRPGRPSTKTAFVP